MNIPDEASRAAQKAVEEYRAEVRRNFPPPGPMIDRAMRAAAPHIVRTAQVRILRELADNYEACQMNATPRELRAKADELEQESP